MSILPLAKKARLLLFHGAARSLGSQRPGDVLLYQNQLDESLHRYPLL